MLGDGKHVELLKLYLSVREKGGYESVSRNGLWDLVTKESGFDLSASASLKLVYVKYLGLLDEWFSKILKDKDSGRGGSSLMDLRLDLERFLADINTKDDKKFVDFKDVLSSVWSVGGKGCSEHVKRSGIGGKYGAVTELCVGIEEEKELSRKRKKECYLPLLDWVQRVAKNPCDPAIGTLPERCKWKAYGGEHVWKQVLSAKEAMRLTSDVDSKAQQSIFVQKKLKMNPTMYDDRSDKSTSRCSLRLISAKETQAILSYRKSQARDGSETSSTGGRSDEEDEDSFWGSNYKKKRTPLGPFFQAEVPQWTGETYESESRWLGTRVWPLEKGKRRIGVIEMERVGKGRPDSCGCEALGSLECIRFHIAEKRSRAKLELGSAFSGWRFDTMGEEVSREWTRNEEKKFESIIKSNPESSGRCFWNELLINFKKKTKPVVVGYYFNVYLLRRRAHQNRSDPSNVDSDDDELEKVGHARNKCSGSILCSPKKVHLNFT